ncbi:MAG TPA: hydroxymethylbilane synthase, partial [Blastocatellia bacterium]
MPNLIIGSRGSKLALWQSNWVKDRLEEVYEGLVVNIEVIKTTGDKITDASLAQIGGKGVFTKEIEEALLDRRIDLAVHSLKDLPTTLPEGLHIAAVTEREDVRDALVVGEDLRKYIINSIEDLPRNARVGTSSLRRASQLRHARPDLEILDLRGNVDTRLRKLHEGEYDAIILASAGLKRLGFEHSIAAYLSTMEMLTAVGQGALAIETRVDDQRVNMLLEVLNHQPTRYATEAERAVLRGLGGGCAVPIAAYAQFKKNRVSQRLVVEALVADVEGRNLIRRQIAGQAQDAEELGSKLAEMLIEAGARDLLPRIGGAKTSDAVQSPDGPPDAAAGIGAGGVQASDPIQAADGGASAPPPSIAPLRESR